MRKQARNTRSVHNEDNKRNHRICGPLARLELGPQEIELYTQQIDSILEHMDALNSVNTDGIESTSHAVPVECLLREDMARDSFAVDDSLKNAPDRTGSFFKVPPIIEVEE